MLNFETDFKLLYDVPIKTFILFKDFRRSYYILMKSRFPNICLDNGFNDNDIDSLKNYYIEFLILPK